MPEPIPDRPPVPPTVILRSPKENPKKCSIVPLRGRPGLLVIEFPPTQPLDLTGYVRLAADGPPLSRDDAGSGILLLDASWRRAEAMNQAFRHVPPRSLRGFVTAYPRSSKLGTDPENGLASVEALYLALRTLGRSTEGLLDHYRWAADFLAANRFDAVGVQSDAAGG